MGKQLVILSVGAVAAQTFSSENPLHLVGIIAAIAASIAILMVLAAALVIVLSPEKYDAQRVAWAMRTINWIMRSKR